MKFRTAYGPKKKATLTCGPGLTRQSEAAACDINNILAQYHRTGVITHLARHQGHYDDWTGFDFHEAMNTVAEAQQLFDELPSKIRKKFANDPAAFLQFATNPENLGEMREMGLAKPERAAEPPEAPPAAPPADAPPE